MAKRPRDNDYDYDARCCENCEWCDIVAEDADTGICQAPNRDQLRVVMLFDVCGSWVRR